MHVQIAHFPAVGTLDDFGFDFDFGFGFQPRIDQKLLRVLAGEFADGGPRTCRSRRPWPMRRSG